MFNKETHSPYLGAALISILGTALFVPLFVDWVEIGMPVTDLRFTGLVIPLFYLCVLVGYVWWRLTRADDSAVLPHIAMWCLAGATLVTVMVWLSLIGREEDFMDVVYILNRAAIRGAVIGLVIGHYSASNLLIRDELKERAEQLEFTNRLLRHDIRNDVMVISGYAELLSEESQLGQIDDRTATENPLEQIEIRANHIAELANIASQLGAAEKIHVQDIPVIETIETTVSKVQAEYPDTDIEFVRNNDSERLVAADSVLKSVFENLLRNAVEHNDQESPVVTVTVEVTSETVIVRVADNGPGLPESLQSTLFEPGTKGLDSSGSGLGLYLVETLIERYGGDIWIESNDPRGSVFAVELTRTTPVVESVSPSSS